MDIIGSLAAPREWKAGDRAMVKLRSPTPTGGMAYVADAKNAAWSIPMDALHPLPPALTPEDAAVIEAAEEWEPVWFVQHHAPKREALRDAIRGRRAARQSPAPSVPADSGGKAEPPALKVGDRVRDKMLSERLHRVVLGKIVDIRGDACAVHFDGDAGPQAACITPLAELEPASVELPAPDLSALRDAVVEAAKAQTRAIDKAHGQPTPEWDDATTETEKAVRALLAAEAQRDPVEYARQVLDRIACGVHLDETCHPTSGPSPMKAYDAARDEARAALAAMKERAR